MYKKNNKKVKTESKNNKRKRKIMEKNNDINTKEEENIKNQKHFLQKCSIRLRCVSIYCFGMVKEKI
jgi:hypothetical protein